MVITLWSLRREVLFLTVSILKFEPLFSGKLKAIYFLLQLSDVGLSNLLPRHINFLIHSFLLLEIRIRYNIFEMLSFCLTW